MHNNNFYLIRYPLSIFVLSLIISCSKSDNDLIGSYESYEPSLVEQAYHLVNYDTWSIGTTLTLNRDSSFDMQTCANIINGKWYIKEDSLYLQSHEMKYRIDSLNYIDEWKNRLKPNREPSVYFIDGEYLQMEDFSSKNKKRLHKLVKVNSSKNH